MTNNEENYNYCKRVAKELGKYYSGCLYRCPECEEITEQKNISDDLICQNCDEKLDESEPLSLYDYFEDFLDVEYIIDSSGNYTGSKIYITLGGPTVWIDTRAANVNLHWGSEQASHPIDFDVKDEIDSIFEEFYENLRERG